MTTSSRGLALQRSIAMTFELIREHAKLYPVEAEQLHAFIVAHIRSVAPQLLLTGGVL